jgi:hypothetical protein
MTTTSRAGVPVRSNGGTPDDEDTRDDEPLVT